MPKKKLDEKVVEHIKPTPGTQTDYFDTRQRGLVLRVSQAGTKTWRVIFYKDRKTKTEALGRYNPGAPDHLSSKAARDKAANFRANQSSILADREKIARTSRESFEAVADWYVQQFVEGQRLTAARIKSLIDAVRPTWRGRAFESITRPEIAEAMEAIARERGPRTADITLAVLRRMQRMYAVRRSKTGYTPTIIAGMAQIENPGERARDRILKDSEIRWLFAACAELGTFGNLVKTLLYTGQRRAKISTMRFDDVHGDVWTIPRLKREKGTPPTLRLPKPVVDIIAAQEEVRTNEFVFGARWIGRRGNGENHGSFSGFGQAKRELDRLMKEMAAPDVIKDWRLHDLRRTARSLMSSAGVRPDIAERVLGHKIPGVAGVYDRYEYEPERAVALQALAEQIQSIIFLPPSGGNVVPIRQR